MRLLQEPGGWQDPGENHGEGLVDAVAGDASRSHRRGQIGRVRAQGVLQASRGLAENGEPEDWRHRRLVLRRRLLQAQHRDRRPAGLRKRVLQWRCIDVLNDDPARRRGGPLNDLRASLKGADS